ncbi:MAG: DUF5063 domain-containing protein [Bacteroidetes bacterium]|nr:DUF5063 domain-containing protein [Bacteroidota bacterium]
MENLDTHQIVYSKNVVEFVTVANEYCTSVENAAHYSAQENLQRLQKLLPLLYIKTSVLPKIERVLDDVLESYVSELDYNVLHQKWLEILNENDGFYEVFDPSIQFGQETVTASVSENLLDIYQDLKNFITSYSIGNEEVMNDSLSECLFRFEGGWGQQLVNVMRAVHMLVYSDTDFGETEIKKEVKPGTDNPKWLDNFWEANEEI